MTDLTARFSEPINIGRPRAGRLIEGLSPKLARRVRLFDHATFAAWIALEADPTVITFCEHPARIAANETVDESKCRTAWCQRPIGESLSGVRLLLFLSAQ
jgi:hypothetical protein